MLTYLSVWGHDLPWKSSSHMARAVSSCRIFWPCSLRVCECVWTDMCEHLHAHIRFLCDRMPRIEKPYLAKLKAYTYISLKVRSFLRSCRSPLSLPFSLSIESQPSSCVIMSRFSLYFVFNKRMRKEGLALRTCQGTRRRSFFAWEKLHENVHDRKKGRKRTLIPLTNSSRVYSHMISAWNLQLSTSITMSLGSTCVYITFTCIERGKGVKLRGKFSSSPLLRGFHSCFCLDKCLRLQKTA